MATTTVTTSVVRRTFPEGSTPSTCIKPAAFIISANSVEAAKHYIISHIPPESIEGIRLKILPEVFYDPDTQDTLNVSLENRLIRRYIYDRTDHVLRITAMGNPIHGAFASFLTKFVFVEMRDVFTDEELSHVSVKVDGEGKILRSSRIDSTTDKKVSSRCKQPDLAFSFDNGIDDLWVVIVEAGFTENYEDLVSDAKQWLVECEDVNIVVIIDIKEKKAAGNSQESIDRKRMLVTKYGNDEAHNRDNIEDDQRPPLDSDSDTESVSNRDILKQIKLEVDVQDWVGPLTAKLEIWEVVEGTPQKRGRAFVCLFHYLLYCVRFC